MAGDEPTGAGEGDAMEVDAAPKNIQPGAGKGKRVMSGKGAGKGGGGEAGDKGAGGEAGGEAAGGTVVAGEVKLPLEVGTRCECLWRDNQYHPIKIIERRNNGDQSDPEAWEYYVHYSQFNRRLDDWVKISDIKMETIELDAPGTKKRKEEDKPDEEHAEFDPASLKEHEEYTKVRNILSVELGKHDVDTWYFSPFPAEYNDCNKLFFCEYCLTFMKRKDQLQRHLRKCELKHPPGDEIYRNGNVCMFEVDGRKEKIYCQNVCYLAKLFLDHKTLYYDVDLFLFYIMCVVDERGCHLAGYFSKEKLSEDGYNLACILTLPPYQRMGYGKFLISMSYELSKKEQKVGTPERPLSDLGLVSYRGYWTRVLLTILKDRDVPVSVKDLSDLTMIKTEDIISTLQHLNLIQYQKGQHVLSCDPMVVPRLLKEAGSPGCVVDPSKLIWTPFNAEREYANYRG